MGSLLSKCLGANGVFNLPVFSRAELTKMVCKCSLVERLDLLPIAVLLMIGGKLPAQRAKSAHFVGHLPTALEMERFFQASKRQVPPFRAKSVHPSVNLPPVGTSNRHPAPLFCHIAVISITYT